MGPASLHYPGSNLRNVSDSGLDFRTRDTALLVAGGFLMQFMVQGAWGVVPVHLNELSPAEFRGTFPGLAYQLGNFAAAYAAQQQAWLATNFFGTNENPNYALTMALVECFVFLAIIFLAAIGPEKHGREF